MKQGTICKKRQIMSTSELIFIKEVDPIVYSYSKKRMAIFQCRCGKLFKTSVNSVRSGHAHSCGCYHKEVVGDMRRTHNKSLHTLYKVWAAMKERCLNPSDPRYVDYGGRGILIFSIWQVDFQSYYDYITALPNYREIGFSIDRIDNNGNYFPGNLRWTNQHFQVANSRKRKDNTSGYRGVYFNKRDKNWNAAIFINGINHNLGYHDTPEIAVMVRNNYIEKNNLTEYFIQPIIQ